MFYQHNMLTGLPFNGQPLQAPTTHPYLLQGIQQSTNAMNTISDNYDAQKKLTATYENISIDQELAMKQNFLAGLMYKPLICGPQYQSPINYNLLSSDLQSLICDICARTGWYENVVLLMILSSISIATRGRYRLQLDYNWSETLSLYTFVVAESGERKSSLVNLLKEPFQNFLNERNTVISQINEQNEEKVKMFERGKKVLEKDAAKQAYKESRNDETGLDAEKFMQLCLANADTLSKVSERYKISTKKAIRIFSDHITEKAIYRDMEEHGECLSFFEAEGNTIVNMLQNKNSGAILDIFLKGYTGESLSYKTARGDDVMLRAPFISMAFMVQSDILSRLYSNQMFNDIGLTSRFIPYFCNVPTQLTYRQDHYRHVVLDTYQQKIKTMLERNYTQESNRKIRVIQVTPEAYNKIKDFEQYIYINHNSYHNSVKSFRSKLHGTAARIAALLHIYAHDKPEDHPLELREMLAGISIADMIFPHAEFAFYPPGLTAYHNAQKIVEWIRKHRHCKFTSRDVAQGTAVIKNANIFPALDLLESHFIMAQVIRPGHPRACGVNLNFG
ncbi:MAG: DUF3987 domain-containing protein [Clostridiales bacterium]|jgi:hypothetical protein|nr:DUF3987 domain-containing protein [Clostridiales bacterium]